MKANLEKGTRKWNLNMPGDFKECLRTVLGGDVKQEIIELYYHAFQSKNRELYDFMSKNVANQNDDQQVVLKIDVKQPEHHGSETAAA